MIGKAASEEITDRIDAIEQRRALLGFMQFPNAMQLLEQSNQIENPELIDEDDGVEPRDETVGQEPDTDSLKTDADIPNDLLANVDPSQESIKQWQEAQEAIEPLNGIVLEHPPIEKLPDDEEIQEHVEEFVNSDAFKFVFADVSDDQWEIGLVPISHLIAFQRTVATKAYEEEIPKWDDDPIGVLEYTIPHEQDQVRFRTVQQQPDSLRINVISRDPNVQVAGLEVADIESGYGQAISFQIAPKPNFVQVARLNGRCYLKNGYHRVYQLLQAGETHVPCVIRDVGTYEETGGADGGHLPPETIDRERPPMVTDFDTDVAVPVKQHATNKLIQLSAETMDLPR